MIRRLDLAQMESKRFLPSYSVINNCSRWWIAQGRVQLGEDPGVDPLLDHNEPELRLVVF